MPQALVEPPTEPIQNQNGIIVPPQDPSSRLPPHDPSQDVHWRSRNSKIDRPKHKKSIPGFSPWILVTTKLRRRFIYNPELRESFWKFPQDILIAVAELDRKEAARKERRLKGEPSDSEPENTNANALNDEYEEVEVTDDENADDNPSVKPLENNAAPQGPVEFNEDDFASQLAMMEQGGEDGYKHDGFNETPSLDPADATALFSDLLSDFSINPYTPWDQVITNMSLVEDLRYTCLPNMKSRRDAFDEWSRNRIALLKDQREVREKKDPRIAYFVLLDTHASPKLYWPEFKRKFKKEQAMKDTKISDKDREKWYREHTNRLKLPQATLKSDFKALLEAQPLSQLNRNTSLDSLPSSILTDLRYISLRPTDRVPLTKAYIELLSDAPDSEDSSGEADTAALKAKDDRMRRENALKERERKVAEEKKKRAKEEKAARELLRQGEAAIEQAMKTGKDGLRGYLDVGKQDEMEQ